MKSIDIGSKASITFRGVALCGEPMIARTSSTVVNCVSSFTVDLPSGPRSRKQRERAQTQPRLAASASSVAHAPEPATTRIGVYERLGRTLALGGDRASGPPMIGIGDIVPDFTLPAVPAAVSLA